MGTMRPLKVRNHFHQAKWDEELIFELHKPGEVGVAVAPVEKGITEKVKGVAALPPSMVRTKAPGLPEVGQMRVLKHFLRLSQQTLGADFTVDIGQGTCTMKYSPKINDVLASSPKMARLHPLQDGRTVQGLLQVMHELDLYLREISGMDAFSMQPASGSAAILGMVSMIQAYHASRGEAETRDEIITTIFSHPSDAAAAAVKGYKVITLMQGEDGLPTVEDLKKVVGPRTAGLLITNPEDTGIFNPQIREFTRLVHEAGGLCGYDQANLNGIMAITRAREAGFDMCFFNLHKTFSTPHGCGGPAGGALGVVQHLRDFLPRPLVVKENGVYRLDSDLKHSIGKLRAFCGTAQVQLRAYTWIRALGAEGLKEAAEIAVLNNNYLLKKITRIKGASAPYAVGRRRIEQVRYSWEQLHRDTGVTTEEIAVRMADFGMHLWSSHHPFIVPQPFTIEPTESYSREELDEYVGVLEQISKEAYTEPETVKTAPHRSVCHHIHHDDFDDPRRWAITWRLYQRKHSARP
ncbi:glycine dehydrogenase [Geothrix limicola]|uniref:glycine dehydrogenase (aminomethyl-transferring) n=1 Tax=Geothrix limicola TaxID=2927978 RepID=A0ABQ5QF38_9BACT|nr:aminomethyl-transferring glycine dehydrogenase subunit GcvPB [Geothrix limicola]GLH73126.1 glycine dehydrogenase [Geothrix limicola]